MHRHTTSAVSSWKRFAAPATTGAVRFAAPATTGAVRFVGLAALGLALFGGCGTQAPDEPVIEDEGIPNVPVPQANGPKLVSLRHGASIYDRPALTGNVIGSLRLGAKVARAETPYSKRGCEGGWFAIRPRGFVCAGVDSSVDLELPVSKAFSEGPALDAALPYRYGRVRDGAAVLYAALPTAEEQALAEDKHKAVADEVGARRLGPSATDVPLDGAFLPTGVPVLERDAAGVGPDGYRTVASWFSFPGPASLPSFLGYGTTLVGGIETRVLKAKSGVAITGSFVVGEGASERRFGIAADGQFVPIDRLNEALGSTFFGIPLRGKNLPVGFALRNPHTYRLKKDTKPERLDEELEHNQALPLTGRFRTIDSTLFYSIDDERWIRHRDLILVQARHKFPEFASGVQKWIDISLANQTLIAWEGRRPVFATLVSTGQDRLGDPNAGAPATLQGTFRVRAKHVTMKLDDAEAKGAFSIADAPWGLEFADGFAITGSYWQKNFGEAENFHNVTLAPVDAHWLWHWATPELPEGWHSTRVAEDTESTMVFVHK
ncbi:MAG: L,D-transpeptidase [Myxococcales bacterium]|nr:L,D-transpeptidase [Myxococcales bacterium]